MLGSSCSSAVFGVSVAARERGLAVSVSPRLRGMGALNDVRVPRPNYAKRCVLSHSSFTHWELLDCSLPRRH
jgi:hypothetical protein